MMKYKEFWGSTTIIIFFGIITIKYFETKLNSKKIMPFITLFFVKYFLISNFSW